jgi:hypothetical protein
MLPENPGLVFFQMLHRDPVPFTPQSHSSSALECSPCSCQPIQRPVFVSASPVPVRRTPERTAGTPSPRPLLGNPPHLSMPPPHPTWQCSVCGWNNDANIVCALTRQDCPATCYLSYHSLSVLQLQAIEFDAIRDSKWAK